MHFWYPYWYIHAYIYTHTHTCVGIYIHIHTHTHTYTHIHTYICMCVYTYTCVCACIFWDYSFPDENAMNYVLIAISLNSVCRIQRTAINGKLWPDIFSWVQYQTQKMLVPLFWILFFWIKYWHPHYSHITAILSIDIWVKKV